MQYVDMVIEASNATLTLTANNQRTGTFQIRVFSCPVGEMKPEEAVLIPYDDKQLQGDIEQLDQRSLDQAGMIVFGRKLADSLLPVAQPGTATSMRDLYTRSLQKIGQDTGLRLCLRMPPQLAALPWEYTYVDAPGGGNGTEGFLALNRRVSIVRHEPLDAPAVSASMAGPVKVVVALASVADLPSLNLTAEKGYLQQALQGQAELNVVYLDNATLDTLQGAMAGGAGVFHFAGHGAFPIDMGPMPGTYVGTGLLALADKNIDAGQIGILLGNHGIRLAVLGACETGRRDGLNEWSSSALALVKEQVPVVIANQFTIRDRCALEFHRQFYHAAIVGGLSIEEAVSAGRIAAYLAEPGGRDWGSPVLYLRGADSQLFTGSTDDATREQARNNVPSIIRSDMLTWDELLKRSQVGPQRLLGTSKRPGVFIPDLYVHRSEIEDALNAFLTSDAAMCIVVGDSGIGKTNMLAAWMMALQVPSNAVFFYDCISFLSADIVSEVARNLSPGLPNELSTALERVSSLAAQQGKQCVLIFDGISQFHDGTTMSTETLIKNINDFVRQLPHQNKNIRVVVSCRTAAWRRLDPTIAALLTDQSLQPQGSEDAFLSLEPFGEQMLRLAYENYAQIFQVQTPFDDLPSDLRQQLLYPVMLRLLAETYHYRSVNNQGLVLDMFADFYEDRISRLQDQVFINKLAAKMLEQRRGIFALQDLAVESDVGPDILSTDSNSSYNRLLDEGVLTVVTGNMIQGDMLKFAYDQLAGYIFARYLLRKDPTSVSQIPDLIHDVRRFPLAWNTSLMMLLLNQDKEVLANLALNSDIEVRELVVETLVEIYTNDSKKAVDLIQYLLQKNTLEVQRTALKAAAAVNPPARAIFLWAATQDSASLQYLTRDILYVIWLSNPEFTYGILSDLTANVSHNPFAIQSDINVIAFIIVLLVAIYNNHCEQKPVIKQGSDIFYDLTKNKLYLDVWPAQALSAIVEPLIFQRVLPMLTKPFVNLQLFPDIIPVEHFFALPPDKRVCLKKIAPFLDPQTDLSQVSDDIVSLLASDIIFFRIVAALVLSIHAYHDFAAMRPLLLDLFEKSDGHGRLWLLLSFAVLLSDTPPAWVELTEEFTRRLIEEHPGIFYGDEVSFLKLWDIALLPLGLAYGKSGSTMLYFEALFKAGVQQKDSRLLTRCIQGLAPVGFYYPNALFAMLYKLRQNDTWIDLQDAIVNCLGMIRVLNSDAVDDFLRQIGADEAMQRSVAEASNIDLAVSTVHLLGYYNNVAHFSQFYPKMRERLAIDGLTIVAEATSAKDFVSKYTQMAVQFTQEAAFQLKNWLLPE